MNRIQNNPFQGFMNGFQNFMQNPMQYMMQKKINIPEQYMKNPTDAIQYLMDSGVINQNQYNQAKQMAEQLKDNPMFKQMYNR